MASTDPARAGRPVADVHDMLLELVAEVGLKKRSAPASKAEIAEYCQVDQATLWRHRKRSAQVNGLVEQLLAARVPLTIKPPNETREEQSPTVESVEYPLSILSDIDLARRGNRGVRTADAVGRQIVSRLRKVKHPSDLPRALFHLVQARRKLDIAIEDLNPIVDEYLRRRRQSQPLDVDQPELL